MDYANCVMLHLHLKHNYFNTIFKTQNKSHTASGSTVVSSTPLKLKIMGMQMHSALLCEFKLKNQNKRKKTVIQETLTINYVKPSTIRENRHKVTLPLSTKRTSK